MEKYIIRNRYYSKDIKIVDFLENSLKTYILMISSSFFIKLISYIPYIGFPLFIYYTCWLYSYYCWEYIWYIRFPYINLNKRIEY